MSEVRIEHVYECSEETFWNKLFLDEEYNQRMFSEALKFPVWKVLKSEERENEVVREIDVVPRLGDLPTALKKVVGENVGYREQGVWDKTARRYRLSITPNKLGDKLAIKGELFTEPAGPGKCRRVYKGSVEAKIFGVGSMLEKRILADLEKSYEVGARFTNQFLKDKGLTGT